MLDTILFDLDGTLLPMDQEKFIKCYSEALFQKLYPSFKEKTKEIIYLLLKSIEVMYANDGSKTNEMAFWEFFESNASINKEIIENILGEFYSNEFKAIMKACSPSPLAKDIIELLIKKGYKVALTTNPFFPRVATWNRVKWAGIDPNYFELITVYENSSFCKPNPNYFIEVLNKINKKCENCLMVGNDVLEDGSAQKIGIPFYLIKDCLINTKNLKIEANYIGSLEDFYNFIKNLPSIK